MSLLTKTGVLQFGAEVDASALPAFLASTLQSVDARRIEVCDDRVKFNGGMFRLVGSWNVLHPFGSGILVVDPVGRQVRYQLSFSQLLVATTIVIILIAIVALVNIGWQPLIALPIGWIWLVGGSLVIGLSRFHRFIQKALAGAPRR
jgi:hypothetical protein